MSAGPASRVRFQIALVVAWLIRASSSAVRACTCSRQCPVATRAALTSPSAAATSAAHGFVGARSEEHTSELQSHHDLVCRLLLEKKNKKIKTYKRLIKKKKKRKK